MNNGNNSSGGNRMAAAAVPAAQQGSGLKAYFKTPEGRYKLSYEKSHPTSLLHYNHGKAVSQATLAYLKDKPVSQPLPSTTLSTTGGVKLAAARFLSGSNGSRTLSFGGGNGSTKVTSGSKSGSGSGHGSLSLSNGSTISNYDGEGTYLVFNVGDTIFISDFNSNDKDPIKAIHFSNANPICHAFDPDAKDGHDLIVGLNSGDVYTVSLRQQLQDPGKKLVGAQHYNKDGSLNNSRCTAVGWVPDLDGIFAAAHADGNIYIYDKNKDGSGDSSFPAIKDPTHFAVSHARSSRSNPIARWHICQGSINSISFSDGGLLATVGRDGYLRIFDFSKEQLLCGGKSYYGALLCCAWSPDSKYVLTGGEDDLVQVWSMKDRAVVAWGEGHNSWVSGVAFDSYWTAPSSDSTGENIVYRFGSVGQDTQLLLWDLAMDEIVVPLRRCVPGGSPTYSSGSQSSHWESMHTNGTLQPSPSMRDVPKLSPVMAHRVHNEPLSGLIFTKDSVVTACHEGHFKIWSRPSHGDSVSNNSDPPVDSTKEKHNSHKIIPPGFKP